MLNNKIFIINPSDVKAFSTINLNVDDNEVARAIRVAQNTYLREIIGEQLLSSIQALIEQNLIDTEGYEVYADLCDVYCAQYLIAKANAEICMPVSLKIRNVGVAQDSDTNINAAQLSGIKELYRQYETIACDAANRIVDYLIANKSAFPEIEGNGCICGLNNGANLSDKYVNIGLWLGGK